MRNAFIEHMIKRVEEDPSIFLVVGDLGYTVVDPFVEKYPERFLNAGVAEQNMTSVACGLAREGYKVFTYSIGNFTTLRCLEQIRSGICYHQLPVCVVSVGGGFMYGYLGPTHHLTEDIAIMRSLPYMRVFVPFSKESACKALDEVVDHPGPAYIRLGREGIPFEDVNHNGLTLIKSHEKQAGKKADQAVLFAGKLSREIIDLAQEREADIYALCRIKPLPEQEIREWCASYRSIVIVEDHQKHGGLQSAVAELVSDIEGINIDNAFSSLIGGGDDQRKHMLFDSE